MDPATLEQVATAVPASTPEATTAPDPNSLPITRGEFSEFTTKFDTLLNQLSESEPPATTAPPPDDFKTRLYADPAGTIQGVERGINEKLDQRFGQMQKDYAIGGAVSWLENRADYSPDLRKQLAGVVQQYGLDSLSPLAAVKLAYKYATGRDPDASPRNTGLKDQLSGPNAKGVMPQGSKKWSEIKAQLRQLDKEGKSDEFKKLDQEAKDLSAKGLLDMGG